MFDMRYVNFTNFNSNKVRLRLLRKIEVELLRKYFNSNKVRLRQMKDYRMIGLEIFQFQ